MGALLTTFKKKIYRHKKGIKFFYAFMAEICCYITLRQLGGQVSESIRILCYGLCLFSVMKSDTAIQETKQVFDKPWKKVLLAMLGIYGTFAVTGLYFLPSSVEYERQYPFLVYFVLSFCWIYPIIEMLLSLLLKRRSGLFEIERKTTYKTRLLLTGLTMLPCMVFLFAFNPAITSTDSEELLGIAYKLWQPDLNMIDWHPPFYMIVLNLLLQVCDSVSFLIIVQCLGFAVVFSDGILFLYQCGVSKKVLGLFYFFIAFGMSNLIQLVTLWKDIPYMISLMWLTILLMKFVMTYDKCVNRWGWYIQFVIAIVFTSFFRQNGILPAMAVVALLLIIMKGAKKFVLTSVVCLVLIAAIKGPLYTSLDVAPQPQLKYFSMANDIMYSYYYGDGTVSEEAMEMIDKITKGDPDNFEYNPYWVGYNKDEPSGYSMFEFMKIYIENVFRNPREMFSAVATRNSAIWSIVRPIDEPIRNVNLLSERHSYAPRPYPFRADNIMTYMLTNLSVWLSSNSVYYIFCWRTGIYSLLIVFMVVSAICFQKKRKLMSLLPFVPIAGNLLSMIISSGWTDYRYFWPSMTLSLLLLFYFLFLRGAQDGDEVMAIEAEKISFTRTLQQLVILCGVLSCLGVVLHQEGNAYQESIMEKMKKQNCMESYLCFLTDHKHNAIIEINSSDIWKSNIFMDSLRMSGFDLNILTDDTDCIILCEGEYVAALEGFHENESTHDTPIGQLRLSMGENGIYSVYLNDDELYLGALDTEDAADIHIIVPDSEWTEIIDYTMADYIIEDEGIEQKKLTKMWHIDPVVH